MEGNNTLMIRNKTLFEGYSSRFTKYPSIPNNSPCKVSIQKWKLDNY